MSDAAFSHYKVVVKNAATQAVLRTVTPLFEKRFTYEHEWNVADHGGTAARSFILELYRVDEFGNVSLPETLTVNNLAPAASSNLNLAEGLNTVLVRPAVPAGRDISGMQVWVGTSPGFTPGPSNLRYDGPNNETAIPVAATGTYYVRVAFYDTFGKTGLNVSSEASIAVVVGTTDPIDTDPPDAPTGLTLTAAFSTVLVEWTNPLDTDLSHSEVWVSETNDLPSAVLKATPLTPAEATAVSGLPNNTTVYVWVRAVDVAENASSFTGPVSVATRRLVADEIGDAIINADKLATGAVVAGKIAANAVGESHLQSLAVTADKVAANAITVDKIASGAVDLTKFASGLTPVEVVATLPISGNFTGRTVVLTTDGKLYRYTVGGWTSATATTDLTGQVQAAQIAALEASKITGTLTNSQIADLAAAKLTGQITGTQITDGAISTGKLAAGSVTTAKLVADVITANEIAINAVTAAKILAGAVTTAKLAAFAVEAGNIAAGAITAGKIAANVVTANELATNSVIAGKIAAGVVSATEIASNAITSAKIAAGAIIAGKIGASAITATEIAANAITTEKIAAGAVTATQIAASTITASQIAANTLTAAQIAAGAITSSQLAASSVIAGKIATDAVTATTIAAGSIVTDKLAAGAVVADKIAANAITATQIATDAVTAAKIQTGAITATKVAAGAITGDKIDIDTAINVGSGGLISGTSYYDRAALLGEGTNSNPVRIHAGHYSPLESPFQVDREGNVIARRLTIFTPDGSSVWFDTLSGFSELARSQLIAQNSTRVQTLTASAATNTDALAFALVETKSITGRVSVNKAGLSVSQTWSYGGAEPADVFPSTLTLVIKTRPAGGVWTTRVTKSLTKITAGIPTSTQFKVQKTLYPPEQEYEPEIGYITWPGFKTEAVTEPDSLIAEFTASFVGDSDGETYEILAELTPSTTPLNFHLKTRTLEVSAPGKDFVLDLTAVQGEGNADTLDGYNSTDFWRKSEFNISSYLPLSGGTLTGALISSVGGHRLEALSIGASADIYLYESASKAFSIRTGASGAHKYTTFQANGNLDVLNGSVSASSFAGVGSSLTALNGSNITLGTVSDSRLPSLAISKITGLQSALDNKLAVNGVSTYVVGASDSASGDLNSFTVHSQVHSVDATLNAPSASGWYNVVNVRHRGGASEGTNYGGQLAWGLTSNTEVIAFRSNIAAGTWNSWKKLWHDGNFTPSDYIKVNNAGSPHAVSVSIDTADDFVLKDSADGTTEYFWRDRSAKILYIGTNDAAVNFRGPTPKMAGGSNLATETWASNTFVPKSGGTVTGRLTVDAVSDLTPAIFRNVGGSTITYSEGGSGYGAFYSKGSGVNAAYMFFGNATSGERGRITASNDGDIYFEASGNFLVLRTSGGSERGRCHPTGFTVTGDLQTSGVIRQGASGTEINSLGLKLPTGHVINHSATSSRDKLRVWDSSSHTIGMASGMTFGSLNGHAMTFQMNNDAARGFWWGHESHTTAQGAMSLTTGGILQVNSNITAGGNITQLSDRRLKHSIRPWRTNFGSMIDRLAPTLFGWNDESRRQDDFGFIAQDIAELFPQVIEKRTDGIMSVDYGKLSVVAIAALKEERARVTTLEDRITRIERLLEAA